MTRRRASMGTRAVAYLRAPSSLGGGPGHLSLDAQRAKVEAYAALYDVDLVDVIAEDAGVSTKSLDRPGLSLALKRLRGPDANALIVYKLDRLTRSVRDLGELLEEHFAKRDLICFGEGLDSRSSTGRLILKVVASVLQWEREAQAEATC